VAISFTQITTPQTTIYGKLNIRDSDFLSNGMNEANRTLPCVIGATGFDNFDMQNCGITDNGVMGIALSSVGKEGKVNIKSCFFADNKGRALLLPAHGGSHYQTTIQNCNFVNNTLPGDLIGATIQVGGVAAGTQSNAGAHIQNSAIMGSPVGVFVGTNEFVTMEGMHIDTSTAVNCYNGSVNAENSDITTSAVQCSGCDFKLNGKQVCAPGS